MTTFAVRRNLPLIALLAVVGAAAGHAATPVVIELPPSDRQLLDQVLGTGVVGEAVPALPIHDPAKLFPLRSNTLTYPRDVAHLLQSADGSISVGSEEDARHGVLSQFTPAEPVLLKGMAPGETRESRIDVRVCDRRQPDRLLHRGWLRLTYAYLGAYRVQVPGGSYTASLFKWHYKGKVGPGHIKEIQYRFFVEGMGPVAIASRTDIRAFWIYRDVSTNARLLIRPALALESR